MQMKTVGVFAANNKKVAGIVADIRLKVAETNLKPANTEGKSL
jgi:hypothetical protein